MTEPMHVLHPSPFRRGFGLAVQAALGALLLYLAAVLPLESVLAHLTLLVLGAAALFLAVKGWHGSSQGLVIDRDGLRQEDGRAVAPLARIVSVDRSPFAFKPSNGFALHLDEPLGRAWVPGMWWRMGRRVGVGGITNAAETKMVADMLKAMVLERDAGRDDGPDDA